MRHQNSVFHGLLKQVPWSCLYKLVDEHGGDARIRRVTTRSQLVALLYGQLSGSTSLREIELALQSHGGKPYHVGAGAVSRSTLADANVLRPCAIFSGLLARMVGQASHGLRRSTGEAVLLIELFFRWVKQALKIKHFVGRSENAVRIQIAVALIAHLLIKLARDAVKIADSTLAFARLIRANLMHKRDIDRLLRLPKPPNQHARQLVLGFAEP